MPPSHVEAGGMPGPAGEKDHPAWDAGQGEVRSARSHPEIDPGALRPTAIVDRGQGILAF